MYLYIMYILHEYKFRSGEWKNLKLVNQKASDGQFNVYGSGVLTQTGIFNPMILGWVWPV